MTDIHAGLVRCHNTSRPQHTKFIFKSPTLSTTNRVTQVEPQDACAGSSTWTWDFLNVLIKVYYRVRAKRLEQIGCEKNDIQTVQHAQEVDRELGLKWFSAETGLVPKWNKATEVEWTEIRNHQIRGENIYFINVLIYNYKTPSSLCNNYFKKLEDLIFVLRHWACF